MPTAISYVRFSSTGQGRGSTTERQESLIQEWLAEHKDVTLSNLSQKDLGRSGFTGEHLKHGLGKILAAINEQKLKSGDYVLVEAIDRLGRMPQLDMLATMQKILSAGVTIVTLQDRHEYSAETINNDMSAIYVLVGKIQQAHGYSQSLSQRISAAYSAKRAKARAGDQIRLFRPIWLTTSGKLKTLEAQMVKDSIDLYLKGYGARQILIKLAKKYPESLQLHPSTLRRWFMNKALIGIWSTKGEDIPNVFEPLIDKETYYKLQSEMGLRTKVMSPEETYQLSGLIVCAQCNSRFHFRRKIHNNFIIIYSNCSTYLKRGVIHCTENKSWPYEVLQALFEMTFRGETASAAWDSAQRGRTAEIITLEQEIDEKVAKKDRLVDIITNIDQSDSTKEKLRSIVEEIDYLRQHKLQLETVIREGYSVEHPEITDQLINDANEFMESYESEPIYLRDQLKKRGYKITASNERIWTTDGNLEISIILEKRSQFHRCYIVKVISSTHTILDEDGNNILIPEDCYFMAVDRKGIRAGEKTMEDLLERLQFYSDQDYVEPFEFQQNITIS